MIQMSKVLVNNYPVLIIVLPLVVAFALSLVKWKPVQRGMVLLTLLFMASYSGFLLHQATKGVNTLVVIAGVTPPMGINLYFSKMSSLLIFLITLASSIIYFYSFFYKREEPELKFNVLFLLITLGATGIVATGDLFNFFVFLEIASISGYALTGFNKDKLGTEASIKYLIIGSLSSIFVLIGIALIYAETGTLNMADIANKLKTADSLIKSMIFLLFLTGIGIESELFPLNGWAPDAYVGAPTPVSAFFSSGLVKAAGVYSLGRIMFSVLGIGEFEKSIIIVIAASTLLISEGIAMVQTNIKRLFAYSSMGQVALVILALSTGDAVTGGAGIFQLINHALFKLSLFLLLGNLALKMGGKELENLRGAYKKSPFVTAIFTLLLFALVGMPPFSGFVSKFFIITGLFSKNHYVLVIIILLSSFFEVYYVLRIVKTLYSPAVKTSNAPNQEVKMSSASVVPIVILVLLTIGMTFYYRDILNFFNTVYQEFSNRNMYINNILKITASVKSTGAFLNFL